MGMGGIVGIQFLRNLGSIDKHRVVQEMLDEISHRAPFSGVYHLEQGSALGIRYHTPVDHTKLFAHDGSRKLYVVMDGEIFDGFERSKLNKTGFSDAGIVLELYREKGTEFLNQIDGSFAIAIWDGVEKKLVLARDRVGFKSLFYAKSDGAFLFGSEIKSLLASKLCPRSVDLQGLNNFLSYGYVCSPGTMFESIFQVKPGHLLVFKDGKISEEPYWRFNYRQEERNRSESYYKEKFLDIFKKAVSRRMERHPDCGAFLSGGLDTSGVVAMMYQLKKEPFKVFTGGFEDEQYNEISDAQVVSDHLGLDQHSIIIKFDADFPKLLQRIVWHHDAPFADTSAIPSYFASKLAKEHVDVVLTGDFPDQLIGGSGHHVKFLTRQRNDSFVYRSLRNKPLNKLVTLLPWKAGSTSFFDKGKRMLYRETFLLEEQRIVEEMPVPELLKRCLYGRELLEINSEYNPLSIARSIYSEVKGHDLLDKLLYFDVLSYAPDDLMVKVERMTMAHGLEAFSPFHDRELIEFVAGLPTHLKIKGEIRKYIMREALKPFLPEHTLNKKKRGFDMPIAEWMIKKFPDYVREVLLDTRALNRGYFDKAFLKRMVDNFLALKTDYASGSDATIISLLTLEVWHRLFVDGH
jgi:asparagine synthase (glutamine-hydrolysing)